MGSSRCYSTSDAMVSAASIQSISRCVAVYHRAANEAEHDEVHWLRYPYDEVYMGSQNNVACICEGVFSTLFSAHILPQELLTSRPTSLLTKMERSSSIHDRGYSLQQ